MAREWKLTQYDAAFPAIVAIVSGMIYFIRYHTLKTFVVLVFVFSGPFYIVWQYFGKEQVTIERLSPLEASKDGGFNLKLMEEAYAAPVEPQGTPIIIKGQKYGYADAAFTIWKIYGQPKIVIYDSLQDVVLGAEIPILEDRSRMKQFKK